MTKKIAELCTDGLLEYIPGFSGKRAVILYGMELLVATVIGIIQIAVISIICGEPIAWIIFLLSYVPLRRTAGGYHADSHLLCYLTFSTMFWLCLFAVKLLKIPAVIPSLWFAFPLFRNTQEKWLGQYHGVIAFVFLLCGSYCSDQQTVGALSAKTAREGIICS